MKRALFTARFKKDVKRQSRRGKSRKKLEEIVNYVCNHGDAPVHTRPHKLVGNWVGCRECHIEPDWLLIYRTEEDHVIFTRTGTHSDLFN